MADKKDQQRDNDQKEESFTGSPEQQFPDLEAEDRQELQEQKSKQKDNPDSKKEN